MIHPLFALFDPATDAALEKFSLTIGGVLAAVWYAKQIFFGDGKQRVKVDQPLAVTIVEEMHKRFAERSEFEKHVVSNTQRHAQLFNELDRIERAARDTLDRRMTDLNEDRRQTLADLNSKLEEMRKEISSMPSRIITDILNAQKLGRKND